jgi:hypothetical protein
LGAGIASATAAIVGALTNPYAERVNDAYRHGAQTGLVVRYTVLGAVAAWLLDLILTRARRRGSLRAALSERSVRAQLQIVGLVLVVLLTVVPIFTGGYDRVREEHAGFVAGCGRTQPERYCECLWTRLNDDPASDSSAEREAMVDQAEASGVAPPALRRAANRCATVIP